jgi:hypothetical protein
MARSDLPTLDLSAFTGQKLAILARRLMIVATALQTEIKTINPCLPHPGYLTFQHLARLMRWRRYLAYLTEAVHLPRRLEESPTLSLAGLPPGPDSRRYFIELLRSQRYRAEMNAYSIRANIFHEPALKALIESGQAEAIDIEARFYSWLLDNLSID